MFMQKLASRTSKLGERGFSFIELVIVVAVIGILTSIAIPSYGAIQSNAKQAAVEANAQTGYKLVAATMAGFDVKGSATTVGDAKTPEDALASLRTDDIDLRFLSPEGAVITNPAADFCVWAFNTKGLIDGTPKYSALYGKCYSGEGKLIVPGHEGSSGGVEGAPAPGEPGGGNEETPGGGTTTPLRAPALAEVQAPDGVTTTSYFLRIVNTGGAATFTATNLPPGLSIAQDTGAISGRPTSVVTRSVTVVATNATGSSERTFNLRVVAFQAGIIYRDDTSTGGLVQLRAKSTEARVTSNHIYPAGAEFTSSAGTHPFVRGCTNAAESNGRCAPWVFSRNANLTLGLNFDTLKGGTYNYSMGGSHTGLGVSFVIKTRVLVNGEEIASATGNNIRFTLPQDSTNVRIERIMDTQTTQTGRTYYFGNFLLQHISGA